MTLLLNANTYSGSVDWLLGFGYSVTEQWFLLLPFQQTSERRSWFFNLDQICLFSGKKNVHDIYGAWHCQTDFVQILSFIKKRGSEPGRRVDGWGFPQDLWPKGQNSLAHCILAAAEFSFHLDTANVSIEPQNHRKVWLEETSGNNPIHLPAQSRANFNSCSYLYTSSACVQK